MSIVQVRRRLFFYRYIHCNKCGIEMQTEIIIWNNFFIILYCPLIINLSWIRSCYRLYCLRRLTQKRYQIFNTIQFINKTIALGYYRKHCTPPTLIKLPPVLYVLHTMLTCRNNAGKTRSNNHKNSRMYFLKYYFHSSLTGRVTSKNSNVKRNIITLSDPIFVPFVFFIYYCRLAVNGTPAFNAGLPKKQQFCQCR